MALENIIPISTLESWAATNYSLPCPVNIKDSVLVRNSLPNSTWVETGTFYGSTTRLLSKFANHVHTLEPSVDLYKKFLQNNKDLTNVSIYNEISENCLPVLVPQLSGTVCFYLDGHFSGGETFAGPNETPLLIELDIISKNLFRFTKCLICIDDIRICGKFHSYGYYPSLDDLVDWARSNNLNWHIEYDMFVVQTKS